MQILTTVFVFGYEKATAGRVGSIAKARRDHLSLSDGANRMFVGQIMHSDMFRNALTTCRGLILSLASDAGRLCDHADYSAWIYGPPFTFAW
jgi:hypothetical protein